jgi:hypothetical protein
MRKYNQRSGGDELPEHIAVSTHCMITRENRQLNRDPLSGTLLKVNFTFPVLAKRLLTLDTFAASSAMENTCHVENIRLRCEIITAGFVQISKRPAEAEQKIITTLGEASGSTREHQIR